MIKYVIQMNQHLKVLEKITNKNNNILKRNQEIP